MASTVSRHFTKADGERIRVAVADAERRTSGEIVPYVVEQCDAYEVAEWRGGALAGTATATLFAEEGAHVYVTDLNGETTKMMISLM